MTAFQWFTLVQTVVMALAAAGVALLYRGFHTGKWVQDQESRGKEVEAINRRLDKAGSEMSDLANVIQKMPDQFHERFVPRETYLVEMTVVRERHKDLRDEWGKELNTIWITIRDLQSRRRSG